MSIDQLLSTLVYAMNARQALIQARKESRSDYFTSTEREDFDELKTYLKEALDAYIDARIEAKLNPEKENEE